MTEVLFGLNHNHPPTLFPLTKSLTITPPPPSSLYSPLNPLTDFLKSPPHSNHDFPTPSNIQYCAKV